MGALDSLGIVGQCAICSCDVYEDEDYEFLGLHIICKKDRGTAQYYDFLEVARES